MKNSIDLQSMIDTIADRFRVEDGLRRAYAVVCNPAIYVELDRLLNPDAQSHTQITGRTSVALHEWCPLETVYFPKDKPQYDALIASLDRTGEKMTGRLCIERECDQPVEVSFGVGKPGLCQHHADELDRKATWPDH